MLNAILTWASLGLAVVGVALAIFFYRRQKVDGRVAADIAEEMSGEITELRLANERSERRRTPVYVRLEQPFRAESIDRPKLVSDVLGQIFVSERHMVVVYGGFGLGKTWLAHQVEKYAQEPDLHLAIAPFSDGVLSASLGRSPAIPNELRKWHHEVTATYVPVADDQPAPHDTVPALAPDAKLDSDDQVTAGEIERRLAGRYPLVIIDDAWSYEHLESLLAAVPQRPVLVTTRELGVRSRLEGGGAEVIDLDGLSELQKKSLLAKFIDHALNGEPTVKTTRFVDHLSRQIGNDPYTVAQAGAEVRARLRDLGGSWTAVSQQRLDDLVAVAASWNGGPGAADSGSRVFAARLEGLKDPLQLAVLRTLSLLRARPEGFSAEEIAALCLPRDDQDPQANEPPAIGAIEQALEFLDKACYLESSPDQFRYSLHNLSRKILSDGIGASAKQDFHRAAVRYWRSWVDPRDPNTHVVGMTSYQIAINREGADWLRAARNLVYHLRRLDDRAQARKTFTAIYFELFFWWGFYLRYPALEEFVGDWQTMRRLQGEPLNADDEKWFDAIRAFHHSYTPGHTSGFPENDPDWLPSQPDYRGAHHDWSAVTDALTEILQRTGLDGPIDSLNEHDEWHTRALIDAFLADSYRYRLRAAKFTIQIDERFAEARSLIRRCNKYDTDHGRKPACDWLLSWVDRAASDDALRRALEAPDETTRTSQLHLAQAGAATAIRDVLTGPDGAAITKERAELDYETIALASLTYGDACVEEASLTEAALWYATAIVLTAAWNYRPVTDDYTRMFSGHVSEHVRIALRDLAYPNAAAPARRDGTAVLHRVQNDGYICQWGRDQVSITSVDPAVLRDPHAFMSLLIGPFPAAGKHDLAGLIPEALDEATEKKLTWVWKATEGAAADDGAEQALLTARGRGAPSGPGQVCIVPGT